MKQNQYKNHQNSFLTNNTSATAHPCKMDDLREKFNHQKLQKQIASQQNLQAVREELSISKTPLQKTIGLEWKVHKAKKLKQKIQAQEEGINLDRLKNSTYTLDQVHNWNEKQEYKQNIGRDPGFTNYNQLSIRKYRKITDAIQPLSTSIPESELKQQLADEFKNAVKNKRAPKKGSQNDDEDVTFINERNMKFNQKLDRFYSKYTADAKESFERGTAVD